MLTVVVAHLRRLGSGGLIVLAALTIDLLTVLAAAATSGPTTRGLLVLPGIVGMAWCAWYGARRAVVASFAATAVLVVSSVLIRDTGTQTYTTLLPNASFTETVAALELVVFCARFARPLAAIPAVTALVVGGLATVFGRDSITTGRDHDALVYGMVLLLGAIVLGLVNRNLAWPATLGDYATAFREHWAMVGVLAVLLFVELAAALEVSLFAVPFTVFTAAMAVVLVRGVTRPARAAVIIAGLMSAVAVLSFVSGLTGRMFTFGGVPTAQVGIGILLVVALVRYESGRQASTLITLLALPVVGNVVFNADYSATLPRPAWVVYWLVAAFVVLAASVAAGLSLRARDAQRANMLSSAVHGAQTTERMALARELHDVVAHHVTGIVVQAQAAKIVAASDPRLVTEALNRIETAGTEAMVAMRRLVASMRGGAPAGAGEASENATTDLRADLMALVDAGTVGVPTESHVDLPVEVPQELARSVLRLVQESLTNVSKHARNAGRATVEARLAGDELYVSVRDDGRAEEKTEPLGGRAASGGYGLVGMRERVGLLNGRFDAGRDETGGWRVQAWLPWQEPRAEGEP